MYDTLISCVNGHRTLDGLLPSLPLCFVGVKACADLEERVSRNAGGKPFVSQVCVV